MILTLAKVTSWKSVFVQCITYMLAVPTIHKRVGVKYARRDTFARRGNFVEIQVFSTRGHFCTKILLQGFNITLLLNYINLWYLIFLFILLSLLHLTLTLNWLFFIFIYFLFFSSFVFINNMYFLLFSFSFFYLYYFCHF